MGGSGRMRARDKITVSGNGFGPGGESAFGAARSGSANPARFETKTRFETKP